jgi:hypothetical protein
VRLLFHWFRFAFFASFGLLVMAVMADSFMRHIIVNPPSLRDFGLACGIGCGMGVWYWLAARKTPHLHILPDGTTVRQWPDGREEHHYRDGTVIVWQHRRLLRFDIPATSGDCSRV